MSAVEDHPQRTQPPHRAAGPGNCIRCGAQLQRHSRRKDPVCRVCATQAAQSFLREALANRRRRRPAVED